MKRKNEDTKELDDTVPLCEKCGSALDEEDGEWICPHCDAEIDFLGGEDE